MNKINKHLLFGLYVLGVIILSLLPGSGGSLWHLDKVGHFLAYGIMALLALIAFRAGYPRALAFLFAVALGAILEWGQSFVPGREMSLLDEIANTLGVISGIVLYRLWGQPLTRFAERFIQ